MIPATSILNVKEYWEHFLPCLPEITGVYMLTIGKMRYIGTSINIKNRVRQHLCDLTSGNHTRLMQHAFRLHGFVGAVILEVCDYKDCLKREAYWIERLHPELNEVHPQDLTECDMNQNPNQRLYRYTCFPERDSEITYAEYIWTEKIARVNRRVERLRVNYGLAFRSHPMYRPKYSDKDYYSRYGENYRGNLDVFICGENAQSVRLKKRDEIEPRFYWEIAYDGEYNLHTDKGMYTYQHKTYMDEFPPSILYYDGTEKRRANADALVADSNLLLAAFRGITRRTGWNKGKEDKLCFPHAAIAYVDEVFFPSIEETKRKERQEIEETLSKLKAALSTVTADDVNTICSGGSAGNLAINAIILLAANKPKPVLIDETTIVESPDTWGIEPRANSKKKAA